MTEDSEKGVPPDSVDKLRKMLAYLDDMDDRQELRAPTAQATATARGASALRVTVF